MLHRDRTLLNVLLLKMTVGNTLFICPFIVAAYIRGAENANTAQDVEFEETTAVFTKRRYRDAWNRCIVKRIANKSAHSIKIKARVRAKGQRGSGWYGEKLVQFLRRKCRCQALWSLHLAGDFYNAYCKIEIMIFPSPFFFVRDVASFLQEV